MYVIKKYCVCVPYQFWKRKSAKASCKTFLASILFIWPQFWGLCHQSRGKYCVSLFHMPPFSVYVLKATKCS